MGRLLLLSFKKFFSSPSVPQGSSCQWGQAQGGSLRERESWFLLLERFLCVCVFLIILSHLLILLVLLIFFCHALM